LRSELDDERIFEDESPEYYQYLVMCRSLTLSLPYTTNVDLCLSAKFNQLQMHKLLNRCTFFYVERAIALAILAYSNTQKLSIIICRAMSNLEEGINGTPVYGKLYDYINVLTLKLQYIFVYKNTFLQKTF